MEARPEQSDGSGSNEALRGLLARGEDGDQVLPLVYSELRGLAERRMKREGGGHTLQPTALVHEAWFRLSRNRNLGQEARTGFFRAASDAMRRVLIDHARKRGSVKRGSGRRAVTCGLDAIAVDGVPDSILAIDEALISLAADDPRAAEVVRLRFYGGLSVDEVAETMNISVRTVMREWSFARARLYQLLTSAS